MPAKCIVCNHPDRHEIDLRILRGTGSKRRIAAQFGLSEQSIRRHAAEHLSAQLAGFMAASAQDLQELAAEFWQAWRLHKEIARTVREQLCDPVNHLPLRGNGEVWWSSVRRGLYLMRLFVDVIKHAQALRGKELDALLRESRSRLALFKSILDAAEIEYTGQQLKDAVMAAFRSDDYSEGDIHIIAIEVDRLVVGVDKSHSS